MLNKILSYPYTNLIASLILVVFSLVVSYASNAYITSYFLDHYPSAWLSYLFMIQSILLVIIAFVISPIAGKFPQRFNRISIAVAIGIILFGYFSKDLQFKAMPFIVCVLIYSFTQINSTNSWSYATLIMDVREFKKNSRWLFSAASAAGIITGYLQSLFIKIWDIDVLLVMMGISLIFIFSVYFFIKPISQVPEKKSQSSKITQYPIVNYLIALVILNAIATLLCEFTYKYQLSLHYGASDVAQTLSIFLATASFIALLLQLFVQQTIQKYFGLLGLFLMFPMALALGTIAFGIKPGIVTATILYGFSNIFYYTFASTSREQAINILTNKVRVQAKFILKGVAAPIGSFIASLTVWLIAHYLTPDVVSLVLIPIIMTVAWLVIKVSQNYRITLQDSLLLRRFDDLDNIDLYRQADLVENIDKALEHKNPHIILLGIKLLEKINVAHAPQKLAPFLNHEKIEIRLATIETLVKYNERYSVEKINEQIDRETHEDVLIHLLTALESLAPQAALERSQILLDASNPLIRATACSIVLRNGDIDFMSKALNIVSKMVHSSKAEERYNAASSLSQLKIGNLTHELRMLIKDKNDIVSRNAINSAVMLENKDVLNEICYQLGRDKVSYAAIRALVHFGNFSLEIIDSYFSQTKTQNKILLSKTLSRIEGEKAELILINHVELDNIELLNKQAYYLAYRAKHQKVSESTKMFAEHMLQHEINVVGNLRALSEQSLNPFQLAEIKSRIKLSKTRFLYWLSLANHVEILKSISIVMQQSEREKSPLLGQYVELIETYLTSSKQSNMLSYLFDPGSEKIITLDLDERYVDPWIRQILTFTNFESLNKEQGMNQLQKMMALRENILFKSLSSEALLAISDVAKSREMYQGEVIYKINDPADEIYIVASGEVDITGSSSRDHTIYAGGFFGIMTMIESQPFQANATAKTDGVLLTISKEDFDSITEDLPEVMRTLNRLFVAYIAELAASDDHKQQQRLTGVLRFH